MKKNDLVLTVLVLSCVLLLQPGRGRQAEATEKATTAKAATTKPEPGKAGPEITFEKEIYDFGQIGPRTKNTGKFKFTNTGNSLLKIGKLGKSCGCTVPKLTKKEYAPGESGEITVTYTASRGRGVVSKRVYVYSNDKARPKVALTVKGKIVLKVVTKPERVQVLLKGENAGCPKITLSSVDNKPFAIKSFSSPGHFITAAFDSTKTETKFVLEPKVDIEKAKKFTKGQISIGLSHPKCRTVTIPFSVLPRFKFAPVTIGLRDVVPQKPIRRRVSILSNYNEDFEIESTSLKNNIVKVLSREKVDKGYKFELEITPPAKDKKRFFTDTFYVHIKDGEQLSVDCRGLYPKKAKKSSKATKPRS